MSATALEAQQFGRRVVAEPTPTGLGTPRDEDSLGELFDEAADFLDVSRRALGQPGRTTPRSTMLQPGDSSTVTNCTTSTSRVDGSR